MIYNHYFQQKLLHQIGKPGVIGMDMVILQVLDMDIRSIYAYKQRIEKRMGGKINELFIRSHSVQH